MPGDPRARAALDNFIAELNRAWEAVGPPSYGRLETLSGQHLDVPVDTPRPRMRLLATSTTHDILHGKRGCLPQWEWVASFVACLRIVAVQDRLNPDEVVGTFAEWRARYQAARAAFGLGGSPPLSAPVPDAGDLVPAQDTPVGQVGPAAGSSPDTTHGDQQAAPRPGVPHPPPVPPGQNPREEPAQTIPPAELTRTTRRYLDAYGRTGMRLLRNAEADDGESAYRLAILLLCDDRPSEAWYWLRRAARARYPHAVQLGDDPDLVVQVWRGAEPVYQIGLEYEAAGQRYSAALFYERAGRNGHPEAAYRAGLHFTHIGKTWDAACCFSRAVYNGHPHAAHEFKALYHQLNHSAPLMPQTPHHSSSTPYQGHAPDPPADDPSVALDLWLSSQTERFPQQPLPPEPPE